MQKIFEEPNINKGLAGNVVILYGNFIIGDVPKEKTEIVINQIKNNQFNSFEHALSIDVNCIDKYEFVPGNDSSIIFYISRSDVSSEKKIDFQNVVVAKNAETFIQNHLKQLGFKRKETQLSPKEAALAPAKKALGIAIIGGLLTGYVYTYQAGDSMQRRVRWYIYLFQRLSESVGYLPFLIITIVLVLVCLLWVVKRMSNPPFRVSVVK